MKKDFAIQDQLTLEYHGPLAKEGRMNSYDVATYIMGFSDFAGIVSRKMYGEKIEMRTEIQGFRGDSLDIHFFVHIGAIAFPLLVSQSLSPKELLDLIRECIKVWLHLEGKPPRTINRHSNNKVEITNQGGQLIYANDVTLNVITDVRAGAAVQRFIKDALEKDLSFIRLDSKADGEIAKIEKKDATAFVPIPPAEITHQNEMPLHLLIEQATFKEKNKWKFFDGADHFYAEIIDEEFQKKIDAGIERFGKGDQLFALVRVQQSGPSHDLKLERTVVKVLKHDIPLNPPQDLPFPSDTPDLPAS